MNANDSIPSDNISHIIFITGGTKSGKSEFAEHLARKVKNLSYVALSDKNIDDKDWLEKINLHRKRRPKGWILIETTDLLNILSKEDGPLLIDSIGGFVMESIERNHKEWLAKMYSLINHLKKKKKRNNYCWRASRLEFGLQEYKIGNTYIERIGELQKESQISKDNWLAINGRAIKIDEISLEIPT